MDVYIEKAKMFGIILANLIRVQSCIEVHASSNKEIST